MAANFNHSNFNSNLNQSNGSFFLTPAQRALASAPKAPIHYTNTKKSIINESPKVPVKNASYFLKKEEKIREKYTNLNTECKQEFDRCVANLREQKQAEFDNLKKEKQHLKGGKRYSTSKSKKSKKSKYRKTRK
jgi:hypothetical protein